MGSSGGSGKGGGGGAPQQAAPSGGGKGGKGGGGGSSRPGLGSGQMYKSDWTRQQAVERGGKSDRSAGPDAIKGGGGTMSPQAKRRMKGIGKGVSTGGSIAGLPGAIAGAIYGVTKRPIARSGSGQLTPAQIRSRQPVYDPTRSTNIKYPGVLENYIPRGQPTARKDMKGRSLTGGQIPMRPGSSYGRYTPGQGPMRRGSLLSGYDDNEDEFGGGTLGEVDTWT